MTTPNILFMEGFDGLDISSLGISKAILQEVGIETNPSANLNGDIVSTVDGGRRLLPLGGNPNAALGDFAVTVKSNVIQLPTVLNESKFLSINHNMQAYETSASAGQQIYRMSFINNLGNQANAAHGVGVLSNLQARITDGFGNILSSPLLPVDWYANEIWLSTVLNFTLVDDINFIYTVDYDIYINGILLYSNAVAGGVTLPTGLLKISQEFNGNSPADGVDAGQFIDNIVYAESDSPLPRMKVKHLVLDETLENTGTVVGAFTTAHEALDSVDNDSSFISFDVLGEKAVVSHEGTVGSEFTVYGVGLTTRYRSTQAAAEVSQLVKIGATEYPLALDVTPVNELATVRTVYSDRPDNSQKWTAASVNLADFGVELTGV